MSIRGLTAVLITWAIVAGVVAALNYDFDTATERRKLIAWRTV